MERVLNIILAVFLVVLLWSAYYFMLTQFEGGIDDYQTRLAVSQHQAAAVIEELLSLGVGFRREAAPPVRSGPEVPAEVLRQQQILAQENSRLKSRLNQLQQERQRQVLDLDQASQTQERLVLERGRQQNLVEENSRLKSQLNQLQQERQQQILDLDQARREVEQLEGRAGNVASREEKLRQLNQQLQRKLASLSQEIQEKDKAAASLSQEAAAAPSPQIEELQQRLTVQDEELTRVTALYQRLRDQLKELAVVLASRDQLVVVKDKQISNLKTQISYLTLKFSDLENSLQETEEKQILLMKNLSQIDDLNRTFQQYLYQTLSYMDDEQGVSGKPESPAAPALPAVEGAAPSSLGQEEYKRRVEEIRKDVEVILKPLLEDN